MEKEREAVVASAQMVQKHWRGVLAKRKFVGLLEQMMDQEVDLSGLDLSSKN